MGKFVKVQFPEQRLWAQGRLDAAEARPFAVRDLYALAGRSYSFDDLVFVPRIPLDAAEAEMMLNTMTGISDRTDPKGSPFGDVVELYAGYTRDELRREARRLQEMPD
jgi:hypothetical protein